jgi:hypothetical protein
MFLWQSRQPDSQPWEAGSHGTGLKPEDTRLPMVSLVLKTLVINGPIKKGRCLPSPNDEI